MNEQDVEIAIDEVVLDGPLGARAPALREALGVALARLVAERGLPAGSGGELRLRRATFDVGAELGAEAIAALVAEGLYAQLSGERS